MVDAVDLPSVCAGRSPSWLNVVWVGSSPPHTRVDGKGEAGDGSVGSVPTSGIETTPIAHPEGHPLVSERQLLQLLLEKQAYANYLVTQMCFDPMVLIRWLQKMREAGVTLPAWIGLPGVADRARLFILSTRIGVGQSARILLKQKGLLRRMLGIRPYRPDELLKGLLPQLGDSGMGIPGFHLFSFNDIERTEQWRREVFAYYQRKA